MIMSFFHNQNKYETRSELEVRREDCVRILCVSLALFVLWFIFSLIGFGFNKNNTPILYGIWAVLKFICKWGGILVFILFLIYEIYCKYLEKKRPPVTPKWKKLRPKIEEDEDEA